MLTDIDSITFEAELTSEDAEREIADAVKGRHAAARKYVLWMRRMNSNATPAELVDALGRHYITASVIAAGLVTATTIAAEIGMAALQAKAATKVTANPNLSAAQAASKISKQGLGFAAANVGAQQVIPMGDRKLQFEVTALFVLALADIHSIRYDKVQARAVVYGLSNSSIGQGDVARMAADLAQSRGSAVDLGHDIAAGRGDWSHWAETVASAVPGGIAEEFIQGIETGRLEDVRSGMSTKKQAFVEYGVGAIAGGVSRFAFGKAVVDASHEAFSAPPIDFPSHLHLTIKVKPEKDDAPSRAFIVLQEAARSTSGWVEASAQTVGAGVGAAAGTVTRPFRSVDLDGDGIPDEAQALTAVKGAGAKVAAGTTSLAGKVAAPFTRKRADPGEGITQTEEGAAVGEPSIVTARLYGGTRHGDSIDISTPLPDTVTLDDGAEYIRVGPELDEAGRVLPGWVYRSSADLELTGPSPVVTG